MKVILFPPFFLNIGIFRKPPRRMPKLIHNGFKYVREWSTNEAGSWVCCEYRRWDCQARCSVVGGVVINLNGSFHNHAPHYDAPIDMEDEIRDMGSARQSCIIKY